MAWVRLSLSVELLIHHLELRVDLFFFPDQASFNIIMPATVYHRFIHLLLPLTIARILPIPILVLLFSVFLFNQLWLVIIVVHIFILPTGLQVEPGPSPHSTTVALLTGINLEIANLLCDVFLLLIVLVGIIAVCDFLMNFVLVARFIQVILIENSSSASVGYSSMISLVEL